MLRIDADAIIILDVFRKTTSRTPHHVLEVCRDRLNRYDALMKGRLR
jgi:phage-related protein